MIGRASWVLVALVLAGASARAADPAPTSAAPDPAPDPGAARSLAAMARAGLDARHPDEAALLFDRACEVDPHPIWQVAAGTAWLEALDPDKAIDRLAAALASPLLGEPARARADEQLALARRLRPLVARARAALAAHDPRAAAAAWEDAFRVVPVGRALVLAAQQADAAHDERAARRLFAAAALRPDLAAEDARAVASATERFRRQPLAPATPAPSPAPWWLVGAGGALVAGGVIAALVGDGYRADVAAIEDGARDGVVTATTRAEAARLLDRGDAWTTAGWVTLGVGTSLAALGAGWLIGRALGPDTASDVHVEATLGPSSLGLGARVGF